MSASGWEQAPPGRLLLRHLLETEDGLMDAVVVFTEADGVFLAFSEPMAHYRLKGLLDLALSSLGLGLEEETQGGEDSPP